MTHRVNEFTAMVSSLTINEIQMNVKLGWTDEERVFPQLVKIKVTLFFLTPPQATTSDHLTDTVDYGVLAQDLRASIESRTFKLIENLAYEAYEFLKNKIKLESKLQIAVTKCHPQILEITEGVTFIYGDQIPQ